MKHIIGARLKAVMKLRKLTPEELSKKLTWNNSDLIVDLINNSKFSNESLSMQDFIYLCNTLNISPAYLLGYKNKKLNSLFDAFDELPLEVSECLRVQIQAVIKSHRDFIRGRIEEEERMIPKV